MGCGNLAEGFGLAKPPHCEACLALAWVGRGHHPCSYNSHLVAYGPWGRELSCSSSSSSSPNPIQLMRQRPGQRPGTSLPLSSCFLSFAPPFLFPKEMSWRYFWHKLRGAGHSERASRSLPFSYCVLFHENENNKLGPCFWKIDVYGIVKRTDVMFVTLEEKNTQKTHKYLNRRQHLRLETNNIMNRRIATSLYLVENVLHELTPQN